MACRGVLFALTDDDVAELKSLSTNADRLEHLTEVIEEQFFNDQPDWLAETDKAWDAIHRVLTDGRLAWVNGTFPFNHVILGGELLYDEDDYIMSLKSPDQVQSVAEAVEGVTEVEFRNRYFQIDANDYGMELSDEDAEYTWSWFQGVRELFLRAAAAKRHVLFTADQ